MACISTYNSSGTRHIRCFGVRFFRRGKHCHPSRKETICLLSQLNNIRVRSCTDTTERGGKCARRDIHRNCCSVLLNASAGPPYDRSRYVLSVCVFLARYLCPPCSLLVFRCFLVSCLTYQLGYCSSYYLARFLFTWYSFSHLRTSYILLFLFSFLCFLPGIIWFEGMLYGMVCRSTAALRNGGMVSYCSACTNSGKLRTCM